MGALLSSVSPLIMVGVVLAAFGGTYMAGDLHGRKMANENCEARVELAIQAMRTKEALAEKTADAQETKQETTDAVAEAKVEKQDEKLQAGITAGPCFVGPDADRLRAIWRVPTPKPNPFGHPAQRLKKLLHPTGGATSGG